MAEGPGGVIAVIGIDIGRTRSTWSVSMAVAQSCCGTRVKSPDQYLRSAPRQYRDLFDMGQ